MGKYINTNDLELEVSHYLQCEKESEAITLEELKEITNRLPSADFEPKWIPVKLGMPEDNVPVNITWINRNPCAYYANIKDKPFTATGVYFKGKWYWYSATLEDTLDECGDCEIDRVDEDIEIVAWMPLPKPYGERKEASE